MGKISAIELFLTAGLAATVVSCGSTADVESDVDTTTAPEVAAVEGGEGGEGGDYSAGEQANADFQDKISGADLLGALQEGGHVIYFRHAQTERDYADQADPNMDLNDCDTQRKLNDVGIQQSETIGAAFEENAIPVGDGRYGLWPP